MRRSTWYLLAWITGLALLGGLMTPVLARITQVGLVTDIGKVDDRTFNEFAYQGMMRAVKEFGLKSAFIETQQPTDYEKNIEQFARPAMR
jgi:basic membrane lipoprotein Med (substrate-binding protein (PBP1-ABC) superfamily)